MMKTHVCIHTDVCVRMPLKDTCTHSCMHNQYTHVGRDDRLDVGVREQHGGIGTSADGGHSEGRCPRRAGQRGVECVLGGGLGRWWGQGRGRGERRVKVTKGWGGALTHACTCFYRADTRADTAISSARRCIMQAGTGGRARWPSCCRSAPMPHSETRYGHARIHVHEYVHAQHART